MATTCNSEDDCFFTTTPPLCTSGGSWAVAWFTRLVTLTVLMSVLEPTLKLTVRL